MNQFHYPLVYGKITLSTKLDKNPCLYKSGAESYKLVNLVKLNSQKLSRKDNFMAHTNLKGSYKF